MARRRRPDLCDDLFDALREVFTLIHPAWCILLAVLFFVAPLLWFRFKVKSKDLEVLAYLFGGVPAMVSLGAGFAGWRQRQERQHFLQQHLDIDWLNKLKWQDFERQVAAVYRDRGYRVEEVGGGGADGGIDLRLQRDSVTTIVQCKRWKVFKVGVKPIRELYGVMMAEKAHRAVFIISGVYTNEALSFAQGKPIELVDGAQLAEMLRRFQTSLRRESEPSNAPTTVTTKPVPAPEIPSRPTCPRCGSEMVLRRAKIGVNAGREFWGCPTFPQCRGVRAVA